MNCNIVSPLTSNNKVKSIQKIDVNNIIKSYKDIFQVDVKSIFGNISHIEQFLCEETGYKFFYPFNIGGDGKFYEHFQQYDWYYLPWKWEHEQTASLLNPGMKVLEVGCAKGSFLESIQNSHGVETVGLELNKKSTNDAKKKNLNVYNEFVQEHADKHPEEYDLVCSFQVLEHITEPKSFLNAKIKCLKKGGKLVICVPNNSSFIKYDNGGILNFPPHHMGWWDHVSLQNLINHFNIKIDNILFEPLQDYHREWYRNIWVRENLKFRIFISSFFRLGFVRIFDYIIRKRLKSIRGHSVMAIYTKI